MLTKTCTSIFMIEIADQIDLQTILPGNFTDQIHFNIVIRSATDRESRISKYMFAQIDRKVA